MGFVRIAISIACTAPLALLVACDEKGPVYTDADGEDGMEAPDVGEDGCWYDIEEAEPGGQVAMLREYEDADGEAWSTWTWEAVLEGDVLWPPVTLVQIEIRPEQGGPGEPGSYVLEEAPFAECGLCMVVREGCTPDDGVARCARDYLAVAGDLVIDEMGTYGEAFSGSLTDAYLVETEIDWDSGSFESAPVSGGATWCIGQIEFETEVSMYPVR
jgi:hypothetical protein